MNSRERISAIVDGQPVDRCGYWTGYPHADMWPKLLTHLGCATPEEAYRILGDDVRWIPVWQQALHPDGCFAACETEADVAAAFQWPDPDDFDLTPQLDALRQAEGYYRLSGNLSMFFHWNCFSGFGGMQEYFIRMYTHPQVVHAVTRRANDYYLKLNRRFFGLAGGNMEAFKISHDFGTQQDVMMSPAMFEEFVFPYLKQQIDLGHEYGYPVLLHCCGAIRRILPRLIELGIDLLHPIQACAAGMDAESLVGLKGKVTFVGGIDTQRLLVNGTPSEVEEEVRRVARTLGPLVISPSHEALLPDVPPENVVAMARAARTTGPCRCPVCGAIPQDYSA
jgi:uroporphyrinogen decarboxylase